MRSKKLFFIFAIFLYLFFSSVDARQRIDYDQTNFADQNVKTTSSPTFAGLDVSKDQDAETTLRITNPNAGSSARSKVQLYKDSDEFGEISFDENTGEMIARSTGGTVRIGREDTDAGILRVSGPSSGSPGGNIRIDMSASNDTTYDYWNIGVNDTALRIGPGSEHWFDFGTNGTFYCGKSEGGKWLVIQDSTYGKWAVGTGDYDLHFYSNVSGSWDEKVVFYDNGTVFKAAGAPTWDSISDISCKKDIKDFADGIEVLKKVKLYKFKYNGKYAKIWEKTEDEVDKEEHIGVIAQEFQELFPNRVKENKTYTKDYKQVTDTFLSVNTGDLVFYVINAVKELDKKVQMLEEENEQLKSRLNDFEKRLEKLENKQELFRLSFSCDSIVFSAYGC